MNENTQNVNQDLGLQPVPILQCSPLPPYMHPSKFAELVGLSSGVIGGWIDLGHVPTIKVGKYRMINLVAIVKELRTDINFEPGE